VCICRRVCIEKYQGESRLVGSAEQPRSLNLCLYVQDTGVGKRSCVVGKRSCVGERSCVVKEVVWVTSASQYGPERELCVCVCESWAHVQTHPMFVCELSYEEIEWHGTCLHLQLG
jgi:hypothetical protein